MPSPVSRSRQAPNVTPRASKLVLATAEDAAAIAALRMAAADTLTREYGPGHWSSAVSERGVLHAMRTSRVFVMRRGDELVATLRLATKKPWAIDTSYFTVCKRPLYLTDMAVAPSSQRRGVGRLCVDEARDLARDWPGDAIRLDAYDAAAGAGPFYAKCGFREVGRVTYRGTPLVYFEMLV
ncbi:MAG TPA: GNAT family N-acetyltransferase [Gemmatimonadaceae bacterium]